VKKRLITGIFIAAVFIGVLALTLYITRYFSPAFFTFDVFVWLLMLGASFEVSRALKRETITPLYTLVASGTVVGAASFYLVYYLAGGDATTLAMLAFASVIFVSALLGFVIMAARRESGGIETCFVFVYPVTVLFFMLLINYLPTDPKRAAGMALLFLVTPLTDVFAFLVGSAVRGPKLAPKISPKKTLSGAIGGLLGGILGGFLVYIMTRSVFFGFLGLNPLTAGFDLVHFLTLGFIGSVLTQGGDLLASAFKRKTGIKDYGRLLPGHGGIMDRIDGMMVNAAFVYLYLLLVV